ncbi:MAG: WD40 repeat domain-containing protein, partial [Anaerolineales bacterium]|nr:WD40 repeat domain-containing protein [Anaerolineales bacterium]
MDIETGEIIQRMTGHTSDIMAVMFSPDGRMALSGSGAGDRVNDTSHIDITPEMDLSMRLWDLSTGEEMRRFEGHDHSVVVLTFGPDGRTAISGSHDGSLILWDLETGKILQHMVNEEQEAGLIRVTALAYSPDGRRALASSDFTVNLWDLETGQMIYTLGSYNSSVTKVAFSPNGRYGASIDQAGELRIWDLETGEMVSDLKNNVGYSELEYSPDGQYIISGLFDVGLWSLTNGAEVRQFVHGGALPDVAYSPDGRTAIAVERFQDLHLWDLDAGNKILHIDLPEAAWEVAYTIDGGSALVTFFLVGDVIQYDLSTGAEIQRLGGESEQDGHLGWADAVAVSPDGKTVLTGSQSAGEEGRDLFLWDLASGEQLVEFETAEHVTAVAISPDGQNTLTAGNELVLWDLNTGEALRKFEG